MKELALTRQAVARLQEAPVMCKVYNGTFKKAWVKAQFSRYSVELRVEKSNPALEWASGVRNAVELVYWKGYEGYPLPVPAELNSLVEKLKQVASMSEEEASKLNSEMQQAIEEFAKAFSNL